MESSYLMSQKDLELGDSAKSRCRNVSIDTSLASMCLFTYLDTKVEENKDGDWVVRVVPRCLPVNARDCSSGRTIQEVCMDQSTNASQKIVTVFTKCGAEVQPDETSQCCVS